MQKSLSTVGWFISCVVVLFILSGWQMVAAQETVKWRCQSFLGLNEESSGLVVRDAINRIKEKTGGKFDIEIFGTGSLMPNKQIYDAVKQGMVEMGVTSNGYTRSEVPLANVAYGTPMNFKKPWEILYFYKKLGFEEMLREAYLKEGAVYFTGNIMPNEFALKKPIRNLSDFKGKKLRTVALFQNLVTDAGGAATYIPGSDIYTGLATGVIDGATWGGVPGANSIKLFEICKYVLDTNIGYGSWGFFVNKDAYEKLPEDYRRALDESFGEVIWTGTINYARLGAELRQKLPEKGVEFITLSKEDELQLNKIAEKIWDTKVAPKSPECAKAIDIMKEFMKKLGYL